MGEVTSEDEFAGERSLPNVCDRRGEDWQWSIFDDFARVDDGKVGSIEDLKAGIITSKYLSLDEYIEMVMNDTYANPQRYGSPEDLESFLEKVVDRMATEKKDARVWELRWRCEKCPLRAVCPDEGGLWRLTSCPLPRYLCQSCMSAAFEKAEEAGIQRCTLGCGMRHKLDARDLVLVPYPRKLRRRLRRLVAKTEDQTGEGNKAEVDVEHGSSLSNEGRLKKTSMDKKGDKSMEQDVELLAGIEETKLAARVHARIKEVDKRQRAESECNKKDGSCLVKKDGTEQSKIRTIATMFKGKRVAKAKEHRWVGSGDKLGPLRGGKGSHSGNRRPSSEFLARCHEARISLQLQQRKAAESVRSRISSFLKRGSPKQEEPEPKTRKSPEMNVPKMRQSSTMVVLEREPMEEVCGKPRNNAEKMIWMCNICDITFATEAMLKHHENRKEHGYPEMSLLPRKRSKKDCAKAKKSSKELRHNCDRCDFSTKYAGNLTMHKKKACAKLLAKGKRKAVE